MKKLLLLAVIAAVFFYFNREPAPAPRSRLILPMLPAAPGAPRGGGNAIDRRLRDQQSGALVTGEGRVSRILGDDSLGDRHQRFILRCPRARPC